jgi:UDP-glucose 6-dehydrogenase
MSVGLIGVGFVGTALLKSFTSRGQAVIAYDKYYDSSKDDRLNNLTLNTREEVAECDIIFLCLPTPFVAGFGYDLSPIIDNLKALKDVGYMGLVVIKSTVEPGTCAKLEKQFGITIIHNPEFLTERTAYEDFDNQTHIVIGRTKRQSSNYIRVSDNILIDLYRELYPTAEISLCASEESEAMKMMCNNFYAMKVQIFNEFNMLCQRTGADYDRVKELMLKNNWINPMHTNVPGPDGKFSYGGHCVDPSTDIVEKRKGFIKASEVEIGDKIFDGNGYTAVTKVGKRSVDSTIIIKSRGRELRGSQDHIHMIYDNGLKEILLKDVKLGCLNYIPKLSFNGTTKINMGKKPKIKGLSKWKDEAEITKPIARMLGLYCAEGYSNIYKYKRCENLIKKDYTVGWVFGEDEKYLADEVISALELLDIKAKKKFDINKKATFGTSRTWKIRKRSFWLYNFIQKLNLGHNAHDKNSVLFTGEIAKSFISGWLDGDGYFDSSSNSISGFSRSIEFIKKVDSMLLSLGIHASITKNGQQINISMRDDVKEVLSWCKHKRFDKAPVYKTNYRWSSTNSKECLNGWSTKINSVEIINEKSLVISIETESGMYVANNILTHNCFPKDTKALSHLMKTLGTPNKVLEACIEERDGIRDSKLY